MTEQEYFNNMVRLLTDAENTRLSVKALQDNGKEAELDVATLKQADKNHVKNIFEEKSEQFAKVKAAYENYAD